MISKKFISLSSCIIVIGLLINNTVCFGQKIKLGNVAKIEFITWGGGITNTHRNLEIIHENNSWNGYQTERVVDWDVRKQAPINDRAKTFIRRTPSGMLNQLLTIIAQQKTAINFDLFNINTDGLIKYVDTTNSHLNPKQRIEFVNAVRSKDNVQKVLRTMLEKYEWSESESYQIIITTKLGVSLKIVAVDGLYKLPWNINRIKSYNPNITKIFEYISGNDNYEKEEQKELYKRLDREIYQAHFATMFNWDDFKLEQPASYAMLKNTLTPAWFAGDKEWSVGEFRSSQLPSYLQIRILFKKGDTAAINRYKRYEDSLVNVFKKDNFLFNYLKTSPGCIVYLDPDKIKRDGKSFFKEIKQYYPAIDSVDYKQTLVFDVHESNGLQSKWLVLPDNTLILGLLTGTAKDGSQINFMNIHLTVDVHHTKTFLKRLCMVFDSSGKIIVNRDNVSLGMD